MNLLAFHRPMRRQAAAFWRGCLLGGLGLLLPAPGHAAGESEAGAVYWGSFGEGAGRWEFAMLRTDEGGLFIGYDAERALGTLSEPIEWREDGAFSFEARASKASPDRNIRAAGQLVGEATLEASRERARGAFQGIDLDFESFATSEGLARRWALGGEAEGELYAIGDEEGRCFALYWASEERTYGGVAKSVEGREGLRELLLPSGEAFRFSLESGEGSYRLSERQSGPLLPAAPVGEERAYAGAEELRRAWVDSSKPAGLPAAAFHFIVEGGAALEMEVAVELRLRAADASLVEGVEVDLFRMDEAGAYQPLYRLPPLRKASAARAEKRLGEAPRRASWVSNFRAAFPEGVYLAQLRGAAAVEADYRIEVAPQPGGEADTARVVNASILELTAGRRETAALGFELGLNGATTVLCRAVGPGLARFGVERLDEDPLMTAAAESGNAWKNDDWWEGVAAAETERTALELGAFALDNGSADAALALRLGPGEYRVSPQTWATGEFYRLVELYFE